VKEFESGATRNVSDNKIDYEGHLSPQVLEAYGRYMHEHKKQKDGSVRASDNWQEGIPFDNYMKSLVRHVFELWTLHRTGKAPINVDSGEEFTRTELLSAILFNTMGYFKEYISPSKVNQQRADIYRKMEWINLNDPRKQTVGSPKGIGADIAKGLGGAYQGGVAVRRFEATQAVPQVRSREETERSASVPEMQSASPVCQCGRR
jgi:hypothetical protein